MFPTKRRNEIVRQWWQNYQHPHHKFVHCSRTTDYMLSSLVVMDFFILLLAICMVRLNPLYEATWRDGDIDSSIPPICSRRATTLVGDDRRNNLLSEPLLVDLTRELCVRSRCPRHDSPETLALMQGALRDEGREHQEVTSTMRIPGIGAVAPGGKLTTVAPTGRLRDKNEPCVIPDRLLHRVRSESWLFHMRAPFDTA